MLKPNGFAYLQGNPMYTCYYGHHIWVKTPEKHYKFCDDTNPFEPWEHLTLHTRDEYYKNLVNKDIPEQHTDKILNFILSNDTSKIAPNKIAQSAKDVYGRRVTIYKTYGLIKPNIFYNKVKEYYDEEDLQTISLTLVISPLYSKLLAKYKNFLKKIEITKLVFQ